MGILYCLYKRDFSKRYSISLYKRSICKTLSWGGGSGYRIYVFEESTRRCAINRKGRGRKEGDLSRPRPSSEV